MFYLVILVIISGKGGYWLFSVISEHCYMHKPRCLSYCVFIYKIFEVRKTVPHRPRDCGKMNDKYVQVHKINYYKLKNCLENSGDVMNETLATWLSHDQGPKADTKLTKCGDL